MGVVTDNAAHSKKDRLEVSRDFQFKDGFRNDRIEDHLSKIQCQVRLILVIHDDDFPRVIDFVLILDM